MITIAINYFDSKFYPSQTSKEGPHTEQHRSCSSDLRTDALIKLTLESTFFNSMCRLPAFSLPSELELIKTNIGSYLELIASRYLITVT